MRKNTFAALVLLLTAPYVGPASADDVGHCNYVQENFMAGPFKVCEMPMDVAQCTEIGTAQENHDAVHSAGACVTEGMVGTCDKGATRLLYYEGDVPELEVGCGFQGGTWVNP